MDVILLEKVANLGNLGDRVAVRSGYARNFLLPKGKATLATPANVAKFEARRAELEKAQREQLSGAEARKAGFEGFKLHHHRQGRQRRQAVRLDRHHRHRRGRHGRWPEAARARSAPAQWSAAQRGRACRGRAPAHRRQRRAADHHPGRRTGLTGRRGSNAMAGPQRLRHDGGFRHRPVAHASAFGGGRAGRPRRPAARHRRLGPGRRLRRRPMISIVPTTG